ncbi:MAG TPA: hypothetical protein VHJ78_02230 [Actinomycetota bacterium]|nr:hypothetical protein [Actinomycetota bacterium]
MARPCGEFKAKWENRPDRPGMLTVSGECTLAAVYRIILTNHEPPSEDPEEKVLDLIVTLPSGLPPTAVEGRSTLYYSYKEETEHPYQRVRIIDVNSSENPKQEWVVPVRVLTQSLAEVGPDGTKWSKMERPKRV